MQPDAPSCSHLTLVQLSGVPLRIINAVSHCRNQDARRRVITKTTNSQGEPTKSNAGKCLTSFFFRFLTGSGVSRSGDVAAPAARFLTLISTLADRKGRLRFGL